MQTIHTTLIPTKELEELRKRADMFDEMVEKNNVLLFLNTLVKPNPDKWLDAFDALDEVLDRANKLTGSK